MRSPTHLLLPLYIVLAGLFCACLPPDGDGCAVAPPKGEYVRIAEEGAIIVWHAPSKTQHFIRRATFDTKAANFGFVVPTPTQPKLAPADNGAFSYLDGVIRPKVVQVRGGISITPGCCIFGCAMPASKAARDLAPANVRVLDVQQVGGLVGAVLEADDAAALNDWLKENGYPSSPELVSWLGPYIAEKWKITAFKIDQDPKAGAQVQTSAVRMTFQADRPFFPYREPKTDEDKEHAAPAHLPRLLRVFFVSDSRASAKRGDSDWQARVPWADTLDAEQRARLVKDLGVPAEHLPAGAWMTTFEDTASPRPGTEDVFFGPSGQQTPTRPPPITQVGPPLWIPLEVVVLGPLVFCGLLAVVILLVLRWRRRAAG
jgi:hypothetical protein